MFTCFSLRLVGLRENLLLIGREKVRLLSLLYKINTLKRRLGWRGNFLLSAAEQWLKLELTKNFKVHLKFSLL